MKVAVVGATGLVGTRMLEVLAERNFPVTELYPVASEKSVGRKITFKGKEWTVVSADDAIAARPDVALFSAGAGASRELAPKFAEAGCRVVDLPAVSAPLLSWKPAAYLTSFSDVQDWYGTLPPFCRSCRFYLAVKNRPVFAYRISLYQFRADLLYTNPEKEVYPKPQTWNTKLKYKGTLKTKPKAKGLKALYLYYCYLLKVFPKNV